MGLVPLLFMMMDRFHTMTMVVVTRTNATVSPWHRISSMPPGNAQNGRRSSFLGFRTMVD
jgi:hypothetical protein